MREAAVQQQKQSNRPEKIQNPNFRLSAGVPAAAHFVTMIAAVASENGAPYDSARASTTASSSSVSWQRFSAGDGLGTYELVTRSWSSSVADGGDQTSAAASEVSLVRNGHRVKVSAGCQISGGK